MEDGGGDCMKGEGCDERRGGGMKGRGRGEGLRAAQAEPSKHTATHSEESIQSRMT